MNVEIQKLSNSHNISPFLSVHKCNIRFRFGPLFSLSIALAGGYLRVRLHSSLYHRDTSLPLNRLSPGSNLLLISDNKQRI